MLNKKYKNEKVKNTKSLKYGRWPYNQKAIRKVTSLAKLLAWLA